MTSRVRKNTGAVTSTLTSNLNENVYNDRIISNTKCGANFGHDYYFLEYAFSTLLVLVYHVYPSRGEGE